MMILFSFICAYWFNRAFSHFTVKVNRQVYQDYCQLQENALSFSDFLKCSTLKPYKLPNHHMLYILCPLCMMLLENYSLPIKLIALLLIYLSLLDYCYYLTDIHYLYAIFLAGLAHSLFYLPDQLAEFVVNLLTFSLFFALFIPLVNHLLKKEGFGMGDVFLILALTPIFPFEQLIQLIFLSTLLGLGFAVAYFCKFQRKIDRLPFIPFITLSTFILILATLPQV